MPEFKLPSLKQESQANTLTGQESPLAEAIKDLSNGILSLRQGESDKSVVNDLMSMKSDFIKIDSNTADLEKNLLKLHDDLVKLQSVTNSFIQNSLTSNQYLSEMDKSFYASAIASADTLKELKDIKKQALLQSSDSKFILKTISSLKSSVTSSDSLGKKDVTDLVASLEKVATDYFETGKLEASRIVTLVNTLSDKKTEGGESAISISDLDAVMTSLQTMALNEIKTKAKETDDFRKSSLSLSEINSHLSDLVVKVDDQSKLQIDALQAAYLNEQLKTDQFISSLSGILENNTALAADQVGEKLRSLEFYLNTISDNTDPKKKELSNAEKIQKQDEVDLAEENNALLSRALDKITAREDEKVKEALFEGVSSSEELGEKLANSILDTVLGQTPTDMGGRGRGDRGGKPGSGKTKGASKFLGKGLGRTALKLGSKAFAVGSIGMGAYEIATADNEAEQKAAIGSTAGSAIGAAIGTLGGPLGIVAGAALGDWVGGKIGEWFTNPDDFIPKEIKDKGPEAELAYINDILEPRIRSEVANGTGQYSSADLEDLITYKDSLKTKAQATASNAKQSYGIPEEQAAKLDSLIAQGMTNPAQLSITTGIPMEKIGNRLSGKKNTEFEQTSKPVDTSRMVKEVDQTTQQNQAPSVTNISNTTISSGGKGSEVDPTLSLLSAMI